MKKGKHKLNHEDRIRILIKKKTEHRYYDTLKLINSIVLPLFWEVGKLIEEMLILRDNRNNEKTIRELSEILEPEYGSYFDVNNLHKMRMFASKCNFTTMIRVSPAINWEYIPSFLMLNNEKEWGVCMQLIHIESLSPDKFETRVLSYPTFPLGNENDHFRDFFNAIAIPFYDSTFNFYFGTQDKVEAFKTAFNAQKHVSRLVIGKISDERISELLRNIEEKISKSTSKLYFMMNFTYNNLLFDLGTDVMNIGKFLDVDMNQKYLKEFIEQIGESFNAKFDFDDLFYSLKLSRKNLDSNIMIQMGEVLSWSSIRESLETQALGIFSNSLEEKSLLTQRENGEVKKYKIKNKTLIITTEIIDPTLFERDMDELNIFNNQSLMRFLLC